MYLLDIKSYIDCNALYTDHNVANRDHTASQRTAKVHMVTDGTNWLNSFTAFDPCRDKC